VKQAVFIAVWKRAPTAAAKEKERRRRRRGNGGRKENGRAEGGGRQSRRSLRFLKLFKFLSGIIWRKK